ncbi:MAG: SDR family NAD(P)-dependent oxidoreductase [Gammaproteobacteria bacterium]|nr:SDR family NAD(P)-dependent oxidoreductase [Gammaproteobacteria bacterium]NND38975.1 SDR family NAD(P)-dependent oxidoreductase [Pseudomonadales bacterium]MBT8151748.1 SDR family NAD(P)-dependent oxidoreductase [Gammaproteobacteria bacterium]NNL11577.1 SDR family NAD(P)-dependent oxidoreductase [Pseudomonadales bacterium]NNM10961.1 SDR family NAD(P)-dependent oxidoreductase [Pseudomonadales bacterium]
MAFTGKVALITGGGSGMGRTAARQLAKQGAQVVVFDVNASGLAETAEGYDNIHSQAVDLTNEEAVNAAVAKTESEVGPIDRLYNCAAIMPFGKILEQDAAVMHKIMAINFGGLVNITKAVIPGMVSRGRGDFISFASMAGVIPTLLTGAYSASKSAVLTFTETLYHENRDSGIRFACVCPPPVATPLLDQGKATAWPKMLDQSGDPISPEEVLAEIETRLEKGKFLVFPGKQTYFGSIMRRLFPGLIWKQVHQVEGF